jgi:hypothetical protein
MATFTRTHAVYNPTGSPVTVKSNTVQAHSTSTLTIPDEDAQAFLAAGCHADQLAPGTADADHLRGYSGR